MICDMDQCGSTFIAEMPHITTVDVFLFTDEMYQAICAAYYVKGHPLSESETKEIIDVFLNRHATN
jgi:hypothetical protein